MGFQQAHAAVTLLASGLRSTTSTGETAVWLPGMVRAIAFVLDVTVDEQTAADLLDVYIQTLLDGTNWVDVVHFPQHAGNAGAARYFEKIAAGPAFAGFANSDALAAGNVRDLLGDKYRVRYTIVDDSSSAAFTFSVVAKAM